MVNLMTPVSHSTGPASDTLLRKLLIGKCIDGVGMGCCYVWLCTCQ